MFICLASPEQIAEQNERNDQTLNHFWTNLMPLLDNAPDRSMLQDIIVTTLKVLNEDLPDSWVDTEQRVSQQRSSPENDLSQLNRSNWHNHSTIILFRMVFV